MVNALNAAGITVWQDRAEIRWGDSLISKVEEGLRISRYVIAVVSRSFVAKPWPRRELNAALSREASSGEVRVLPLIVGSEADRKQILSECALQGDKLYEVWTGAPDGVVERLKERLAR
jgi:RNA-directed DNA polymerase